MADACAEEKGFGVGASGDRAGLIRADQAFARHHLPDRRGKLNHGLCCDPHGGEVRVEFGCGGGAGHDLVIVLARPLVALEIR